MIIVYFFLYPRGGVPHSLFDIVTPHHVPLQGFHMCYDIGVMVPKFSEIPTTPSFLLFKARGIMSCTRALNLVTYGNASREGSCLPLFGGVPVLAKIASIYSLPPFYSSMYHPSPSLLCYVFLTKNFLCLSWLAEFFR